MTARSRKSAPELFPISVKLRGRKCVVVGAGRIGEAKAKGLLLAGAKLVMVAPNATRWVEKRASEKILKWRRRGFTPGDLEGAFLVVAATSSAECNDLVYRVATEQSVLCNVVDDPERCDFFYPAVVRRGALQIAVSTGGHSPALAHRLRVELEKQFGPEYEEWIEEVGSRRRGILERAMPAGERRELIEKIGSQKSYEQFVRRKRAAKENAASKERPPHHSRR